MSKKPQKTQKKLSLRQQAAQLRVYGFNVTYGKKGKFSSQAKGAVTRANNKIKQYTENTKQTFIWLPFKNPTEKKEVRHGLGKNVVTPSGFFLRKPKGTRGRPTLRFFGGGRMEFRARGLKGGTVRQKIYRINPKLLLEDPPKAILSLGRKKDKVVLTVNGFDSSQTVEYTLDALAYYLALDLLPKFLDPNLDPAYTKIHGKRHGTKKQRLKQFSDIFHVKVTSYGPAKAKAKTKAKAKPRKTKRKR
jgi:hypothetical protein